jgi:hypothetical protein
VAPIHLLRFEIAPRRANAVLDPQTQIVIIDERKFGRRWRQFVGTLFEQATNPLDRVFARDCRGVRSRLNDIPGAVSRTQEARR